MVDSALALLDDITRVVSTPKARQEVNPLLSRLGMRIGLSFTEGQKGKKRRIRLLASGKIVFGNEPLPVPLFGKDNLDHGGGSGGCDHQPDSGAPCGDSERSGNEGEMKVKKESVSTNEKSGEGASPSPESTPNRPNGQPEGISITKVSRADRI